MKHSTAHHTVPRLDFGSRGPGCMAASSAARAWDGTAEHGTAEHSAAQCSAVQHSAASCSMAQNSTTQDATHARAGRALARGPPDAHMFVPSAKEDGWLQGSGLGALGD